MSMVLKESTPKHRMRARGLKSLFYLSGRGDAQALIHRAVPASLGPGGAWEADEPWGSEARRAGLPGKRQIVRNRLDSRIDTAMLTRQTCASMSKNDCHFSLTGIGLSGDIQKGLPWTPTHA